MLTLLLQPLDGVKWRVSTEDGEVLVASSQIPEEAACRVLYARNVGGQVQFRHPHGTIGLIVTDIAAFARRNDRKVDA